MYLPNSIYYCSDSPSSDITSLSTMRQPPSPSVLNLTSPNPPQQTTQNNTNVTGYSSTTTPSTNPENPPSARMKEIQLEKNLVPLCSDKFVAKTLMQGRKTASTGWDYIHFIDVHEFMSMVAADDSLPEDEKQIKKSYTGLQKITKRLTNHFQKEGNSSPSSFSKPQSKAKSNPTCSHKDKSVNPYFYFGICKHCLKNPEKTLDNAAVGLSTHRITNFKINHIHSHHQMTFEEFCSCHSTSSTVSSSSHGTSSTSQTIPTNQTSLSHFRKLKIPHKQNIISNLHHHIYTFINDCNLPALTIEKPIFWKMLMEMHKTGTMLESLSESEVKIGQRKFEHIRNNSISMTVATISQFINRVKHFYKESTGKAQGFICVCHDLWDGKFRELLGLSITFIDPLSMELFLIPVGLITAKGKRAAIVSEQSLSILAGFSISQEDLFRPINDTTNSALAAGREIVGTDENGGCGMHEAELIIKHATGQVERRCNRTVTDHFRNCEGLRKKSRKMISWIVSPQFKNRYQKYHDFIISTMKWKPFKVILGNDTRVAGTNIMYQGLLRSYCALSTFSKSSEAPNEFKTICLSATEWDQLSQFESIIRSTQILAMELQTNYPAAICISSLQIAMALYRLKKSTISGFHVVETRDGVLSSSEFPWDPHTKFEQLPTRIRRYTRIPEEYGLGNNLSGDSCHLIDRFLKEFPEYFSKNIADRDLATMLHPFMADHGIAILIQIGFGQGRQYYHDLLIKFLFEFHKPDLEVQTNSEDTNAVDLNSEPNTNSTSQENNPKEQDSHQPTVTTTETDEDDIWEQVYKKQKREKQQKLQHYMNNMNCSKNSEAEVQKKVTDEVKSYLSYISLLDWEKAISEYPSNHHTTFIPKMNKDEKLKREYQISLQKKKVTDIWKHFDVLQWWGRHAQHKFPLLFPMASIVLGKPYTNAYQERCFSLASWFDGKLVQSQKAETLQSRCLDAQNRNNVTRMKELLGSRNTNKPFCTENEITTSMAQYLFHQDQLQEIISKANESSDTSMESEEEVDIIDM